MKANSTSERLMVLAASLAASLMAIAWSWRHGAMLNYGDAVAHLHIARRVFDSHQPRVSQLGSVWLPLPHVLMLPFVQVYGWWANGIAGMIPSMLAYLASCVGIYRLALRWLDVPAAALALAFFALNPNLLYLQTTAMTEPLFVCEMIWVVLWMVEWRGCLDEDLLIQPSSSVTTTHPCASKKAQGWGTDSQYLRAGSIKRAGRLQWLIALALVAAVFTRYDGWIMAALAWTGIGIALLRRGRLRPLLTRPLHHSRVPTLSPKSTAKGWGTESQDSESQSDWGGSIGFWIASVLVVAAPVVWFAYNQAAFGDWLEFMRGPYSAKVIEIRTASHGEGPPHPGWHNLWVALLFFVKAAELDVVAAAWGNVLLIVSVLGTVWAWLTVRKHGFLWALLLWLPLPFYAYSVAYGSVPIFLPPWWPHSWYNTRYGMELLPALALGVGFAAQLLLACVDEFKPPSLIRPAMIQPAESDADSHPCASKKAQGWGTDLRYVRTSSIRSYAIGFLFLLLALNDGEMLRERPLVYVEGIKNLDSRRAFEEQIPPALRTLLAERPGGVILMETSVYPTLVSLTGIPFKQTINESDLRIFYDALAAPASHAYLVLAFDGDEIDCAVKAHPEGLRAVRRFTAHGQASGTLYISDAPLTARLGKPAAAVIASGKDAQ